MTSRPRDVLIVEDEAFVAYDLADLVAATGRRVIGPALSIAEARGLVAAERPAVALLDIDVGGERIWPFAAALREAGCTLVFVSADRPPAEPGFAFADCAFLSKPGSPRDIEAALDRAFAARGDDGRGQAG